MYIHWKNAVITRVKRWGNSLGIRIPKSFAQEAHIKDGARVDLTVDNGGLSIRPVRAKKYRLDLLLSGIDPSNIHGEVDTGRKRGREVW